MKMDKEWILKRRFWLLLGTFGLLWFVCLLTLWIIGGGPIEAAKKVVTDANAVIQPYTSNSGPNRPKNDSFLPKWKEYGKTFSDHKITVWGIAWYGDKPKPDDPPGKLLWKGQGGMYTWPTTDDHPLNQVALVPSKEIDPLLRKWYKGSDDFSPYRNQFNSLYYEVKSTANEAEAAKPGPPGRPLDPVVFKGGDRAKGGDYLGVMKQVDINSEAVTSAPSTEECWLMQEDFWVKREVLYALSDAMNMAAHMVEGAAPDAADAPADKPEADQKVLGRRTFHNDSWEVTLLFDQGGKDANGLPMWRVRPDSAIKNVSVGHRDQDLGTPALKNGGVWFRLRQGSAVWPIAFEGTPVPWRQKHTLADGAYKDGWNLKGNPDPSRPMTLEQVFDATNTPIAEIDEIAISKVSHKNANRLLVAAKPERYGQKPPPDAKAPGAPALLPARPAPTRPRPPAARAAAPAAWAAPPGPRPPAAARRAWAWERSRPPT